MKKFILHMLIFCFTVAATMVYIMSLADGYCDPFYLKLSSPKQRNLIIGTSKAAQGIQPKVLQSHLGREFYNYAFAIYASPYGEVYLNSIRNKLDTTHRKQVFILTVDAISLASSAKNPNDPGSFRENKSFMGKGLRVDQHPNFEYLLNCFEGKYYTILFKDTTAYLHNDGWLEVNLDEERNKVTRRRDFTISSYRKKMDTHQYSEVRYDFLLNTIKFLKKYGSVYLVRLPVHTDVLAIEDAIIPDFNKVIRRGIDISDGYFDLTRYKHTMNYTDGVHLSKSSGKEISAIIAEEIRAQYDQADSEN